MTREWIPRAVRVKPSILVTGAVGGVHRWTVEANPATGMVSAAGNPRLIAKRGYTLSGQPEGALIGRIGNSGVPLLIGNQAQLPHGQPGGLHLCINDNLDECFRAGLSDNLGSGAAFRHGVCAVIPTQMKQGGATMHRLLRTLAIRCSHLPHFARNVIGDLSGGRSPFVGR